uniref:Uncharacterized protein n=1 Tax=Trichobilharzia regenti TaxID=157069 RepID=A0AA85J158_TRIRE
MGIIHELKRSKDPSTVKELNGFLRYSVKLAVGKAKVGFFEDCVSNHQYPKWFWKALRRNHIYPNTKSLQRHAMNCADSIRSRMPELQRNINQRSSALYELTSDERQRFTEYIDLVANKRSQSVVTQLNNSLKQMKPQGKFPDEPTKFVFNYSSVHLTDVQLEVLSLGPKFCDINFNSDKLHTQVQFENLISQTHDLSPTSEDELQRFKSTIMDCCHQYLNSKSKVRNHLTKRHREELKQLRDNKDLLITRPDKGAGVVLLNRRDYIEKMNDILSNEDKFSQP